MDTKKAIENITSLGYMLDEEAFDFLKMIENDEKFSQIMNNIIREINQLSPKPIILSKDILQKILEKSSLNKEIDVDSSRTFRPLASEYESDLEIVQDPTELIGTAGTINDFFQYFYNRFEKMSRILKERTDVKDAGTLKNALRASQNTVNKFIVMITEKRERKGKLFLFVEDLEESATILVPDALVRNYPAPLYLTLDQVVCFEAVKGKKDFFIAKNIIFPDIPERRIEENNNPLNALLIADIHFGSKTFLENVFNKMIFWLNGKIGSQKQIEKASAIKYLIIAGDLVDGVGIYPNQEKELLVADIYQQYHLVAQYLEQIPEYIEVIIIPGNHDATSQVLPQPAISREYAEPIYEVRKIVSLGNPAEIKLGGRSFLLYHGNNLVDIASTIPNVNIDKPHKGVEHLLKIRHLAPEFGAKTPISPELHDLLVIERPPDVFQTGHLHREGHLFYRGTQIVCCGAWQTQTSYQKTLGIKPTVGSVSIINLNDVHLSMLNFMENM